jgi:hypothetical protein
MTGCDCGFTRTFHQVIAWNAREHGAPGPPKVYIFGPVRYLSLRSFSV